MKNVYVGKENGKVLGVIIADSENGAWQYFINKYHTPTQIEEIKLLDISASLPSITVIETISCQTINLDYHTEPIVRIILDR